MTDQTPEITPSTVAADDTASVVTDPVVARRTSRRTWFAVAAAAVVGVAVVGGSAYAIGVSQSNTASPKAAFTLSSTHSSNSAAAPAALGTSAGTDSKMATGMMPYYGNSHTTFTADASLSNSAGTATAYAFDAASVDPQALANALAKAVGINDTATLSNGSWVVGSQDGSSANITVSLDGQISINYYNPANDPFTCTATSVPPSVATPDASGSSSGSSSGGVAATPEPCKPQNDKPLGTTDAAVASAKDIIKAIGLNPSDFSFSSTAPTDAGQPVIYVTADQVVDGQLTGMSESFTFGGGNALSSFYGFAAPTTSLGSYDVVSAQDAVARLSNPEFSTGGPIMYATGMRGGVMPLAKGAMAPAADAATSSSVVTSTAAPTPTIPPTMTSGSKFAWPVTNVTIVKADLGLAQYYEPNGSIVLLPTYQLTGSDKSTWTVVAVSTSALDTTQLSN